MLIPSSIFSGLKIMFVGESLSSLTLSTSCEVRPRPAASVISMFRKYMFRVSKSRVPRSSSLLLLTPKVAVSFTRRKLCVSFRSGSTAESVASSLPETVCSLTEIYALG